MEQLQQLWPVMCGHEGWLAAITAWRGALGIIMPVFNAKLQEKATTALVLNPKITNDIVNRTWYKNIDFTLRVFTGIRLPNADSLIVHASKTGNTETFKNPDSKSTNPDLPSTP